MNTTEKDATDNKTKPVRRRTPRPRAADTPKTAALPAGYAKARTAFETRAQDWLLDRPGRSMRIPDDLRLIAGLGVPCSTCGNLIYRDRDSGHTIVWKQKAKGDPGGHWASGITASCA